MMRSIAEQCGVFFVPQLALSIVVVTLVTGYFVAWARRELPAGQRPWDRTLEPLASISCSLGLLGSVVGLCASLGSFRHGIDVDQLTAGLALSYVTTGVGLTVSLFSMFGSYVLNLMNGAKP